MNAPGRQRPGRWCVRFFNLLLGGALALNVSTAAEGRAGSTIKVLTFNIMWEENGVRAGDLSLPVWRDRSSLVAGIVTREEADVVGLQEASPEQLAGLQALLPEYTSVQHEATNNTNPIIFKTGRFKRLGSGAFVLNATPEVEGTNIGVRGCTWVHLEDRRNGRRFHVYSLHLDHRSKGPTRQISAVRLMERITAHGGPTVVTGDFNTAEDSPTMGYFPGRTALVNDAGNSVTNSRPLVTAYKSIHPEDTRRVIDHVLASPGVRVHDAGRVPSGRASDHDVFWAMISLE